MGFIRVSQRKENIWLNTDHIIKIISDSRKGAVILTSEIGSSGSSVQTFCDESVDQVLELIMGADVKVRQFMPLP
jgi:hypothetical protein